MPEISVIVPVYNVENKIRRCIDSILAQIFTDYELILVDDGSTDRSGEICDEYTNKVARIKVIHQKNHGPSAARNHGIAIAKGKYLSFVDSDDYLEPKYLEVLYRGIQQSQLSICGVIFCCDGEEKKTPQIFHDDYVISIINNSKKIAALIRERRLNYIYSKLYIREIIIKNNIRFDENITLGEDTIFVFDYLRYISDLYVIGGSYYNYVRYNGNTLTTVFRSNLYDQYTFINNYIESSVQKMGLLDVAIVRAVDERRLVSALWAIESIMQNTNIDSKTKEHFLTTIFNNEYLINAIDRNPDSYNKSKYYQIIRKRNPKQFIRYYYSFHRKQRRVHLIKIIARRIIPGGLVKWVKKKWFLIAR